MKAIKAKISFSKSNKKEIHAFFINNHTHCPFLACKNKVHNNENYNCIASRNYTDDDMKTNPDEALRFAKETGIDALAISFGSSHGNYPEGYVPEFDFERLKEIKEKTKMPLVLHGGSGSGDENIKKCVEFGINKINVGCDFMNANVDSIKQHLKKDPDINYWVMMHQVEIDSQELVKKYIHLSGSEGKSL